MSADRRWTGGIANREWNRGTAPLSRAAEVMSDDRRQELQRYVQGYLNACERFRVILSPRYHPSPRGMLDSVFCHDAGERRVALEEYARLAGQ